MKTVLVVGAGFSGATVARVLADAGHAVKVVDIRTHVAGNAHDLVDTETGIMYHKYGPHIFHTSNQKVVDFLSRFTEWTPYAHRVKAILEDGTYVPFPPNLETLNTVPKEELIDTFFRPYTKKMWGVDIEELSPEILARVPIRQDHDDRYFPKDTFQAMPTDGYTCLVKNMLNHRLINVSLGIDYRDFYTPNLFDHVFCSAPIDVHFRHVYGELPYRSIKFHNQVVHLPRALPTATVNFTHSAPYTRVTEWKQFLNYKTDSSKTLLTFEEPCDSKDNNNERYYPVKTADDRYRKLYQAYASLVEPGWTFIGRLGNYAYLDMQQAVSSSVVVARDYLATL